MECVFRPRAFEERLGRRPALYPIAACAAWVALAPSGAVRAQADTPAAVSPAPGAAEEREVPLAELLAYAAIHAPALRLARSEEAFARVAKAQAEPLLHENPTLEIAAGPRIMPGDELGLDFAAALAQPFEIAGERGARQRTAERLAEQLKATTAVAELDLHQTLSLAYAEAAVARERLALADELARFATDVLAVTRRKLAAGDANAIELHTAEADAAMALQERIVAEQALASARLALCESSGWPVATPPLPETRRPELAALPALESLLSTALAAHPELRKESAALALAQAEHDLAEREAWVDPAIGVQFVRESAPDGEADYIVLGTFTLPLPLFDRNQDERAKALVEASSARARKAALNAALRVRIARAYAEARAAEARLALFEGTVRPALDRTLELLERGFAAGELPLLDVLSARERLASSRRSALDAYADYARARVELERAIGRPLREGQGGAP